MGKLWNGFNIEVLMLSGNPTSGKTTSIYTINTANAGGTLIIDTDGNSSPNLPFIEYVPIRFNGTNADTFYLDEFLKKALEIEKEYARRGSAWGIIAVDTFWRITTSAFAKIVTHREPFTFAGTKFDPQKNKNNAALLSMYNMFGITMVNWLKSMCQTVILSTHMQAIYDESGKKTKAHKDRGAGTWAESLTSLHLEIVARDDGSRHVNVIRSTMPTTFVRDGQIVIGEPVLPNGFKLALRETLYSAIIRLIGQYNTRWDESKEFQPVSVVPTSDFDEEHVARQALIEQSKQELEMGRTKAYQQLGEQYGFFTTKWLQQYFDEIGFEYNNAIPSDIIEQTHEIMSHPKVIEQCAKAWDVTIRRLAELKGCPADEIKSHVSDKGIVVTPHTYAKAKHEAMLYG